MSPDPAQSARIHRLWDELADYSAAQADAARSHLLAGLCELLGAQNANWMGVVRLGEPGPLDPVKGWRVRSMHTLRRTPQQLAAIQALREWGMRMAALRSGNHVQDIVAARGATRAQTGRVDETTLRQIDFVGTHRSNRLCDLVGPEWFEGEFYKLGYVLAGHHDAIWVGIPVSADAEIYIGIFRSSEHPRFSEAERDLAGDALRGLRWFHRRQMLAEGLLVAEEPLTAVERDVLHGLLAGKLDKQIAADLSRSEYTVREHVGHIFRKYNIGSRSALMALWLGQPQ